ncbi:hypothetical protein SAMN05216228_108410 [Rhizobium tibeticum]|uniref:Uncharacterized protein n=1 Tax=Rhizobium tibeticum TaxID=501024 RepID=A0A1H8WXK2_9HYPH|nr:hypothetical protein RTCCBAU85039_6696 [Rhizobium tibeticum]SEP32339.1 hypothetical protein SAMN05216228_108410 [Rhizobium tibeticum]
MVTRRTTKRPQSILQAFGKSDEAFAAEDDVGMFEAGIGKAEVLQQMIERLPRDGNAQGGHVGKV